jgi:hypothetical protein
MKDQMLLRNTGLNVVFDSPDSVTEVVSAVIGNELIQLLANQFSLSQSQTAQQ